MIKHVVISMILLAACLLNACKENGDFSPPAISILAPSPGESFNVPDTLEIRAEISDDRTIRSVTVVLLNAENIPVAPAKYFYPDIHHYNLSTSLVIADITLESGNYSLMISAFDGSQESRRSVMIGLNEMPRELTGYIAVTSSFSPRSTITRLNEDFGTDTVFTVQEPFQFSGVHSAWGLFCFVSGSPSSIFAYSMDPFEPEWEFEAIPPKPVFSALWVDQQIIYATLNGDAGILNSNGNVVLVTPPAINKAIQCLSADDQYIYAEQVAYGGAITELAVFYRATGVLRARYQVTQDIVSLLPAGKKVLIFGNNDNGGVISEFDPETMKFTGLESIGEDQIRSAGKISDQFFLLLSPQRVYLYNDQNNQAVAYFEGSYDFLRYDDLNDLLFLVKGTHLRVVEWGLLQQVHYQVFEEDILDFQIIYNK